MTRYLLIPALATCLAAPAMADLNLDDYGTVDAAGRFIPPAGCTLELTVQSLGCQVSQHYTCPEDTPGDQHAVHFDREGMSFHSRIDAETRWLESHYLRHNLTEWLVPEAQSHASFSRLVETGRDDMDFWTIDNNGTRIRYTGYDLLPGDSAVIDGEPLQTTRFELTARDINGEMIHTRRGEQYISIELGRFFGGRESGTDWTGAAIKGDDTPMTFRRAGQSGFGATVPQFGCEEMLSDAGIPPAAQDNA